MRRVSILLATLFGWIVASAQEPTTTPSLIFEETVWNFGEIDEVDGAISYTFRYRNVSEEFVTIERVYSACGCTSSDYSRRPLKPGGEGSFTVLFNPEGQGGKVAKSVTLTYNNGSERTELRIRGRVKARPLSPEELYPYELGGGVRSDSSIKPFGKVPVGKLKSMTIALINTSDKEVTIGIDWVTRSGALEINSHEELAPNESALVTLFYSPTKGQSGLLTDEFRFVIDGTPSEMLFRTSAVVDNS